MVRWAFFFWSVSSPFQYFRSKLEWLSLAGSNQRATPQPPAPQQSSELFILPDKELTAQQKQSGSFCLMAAAPFLFGLRASWAAHIGCDIFLAWQILALWALASQESFLGATHCMTRRGGWWAGCGWSHPSDIMAAGLAHWALYPVPHACAGSWPQNVLGTVWSCAASCSGTGCGNFIACYKIPPWSIFSSHYSLAFFFFFF